MAGKRIDPPKLKDGDDYEEWAREIEIWQIVTEIPKSKTRRTNLPFFGGTGATML